jgi:hypothetical protein
LSLLPNPSRIRHLSQTLPDQLPRHSHLPPLANCARRY